jgi:2-polyprenyl-6-methoxyphenol hydroxylase-like FAD-dependent oxidoreductase
MYRVMRSVERFMVRTTGGVRELRARYLVGCDGAGSTVRGLAGVDFAGTDATVTGRMAVVDMVDQEKLRPGFHSRRTACTCTGSG